MIAGEISVYRGNADDAEIAGPALIEVTEWGLPMIEVAVEAGKRRIYIRFRLSDLLREVKEAGMEP